MEVVDNRSVATLLPMIHRNVRPGSILHCDQWPAHEHLQLSPNHSVNHSLQFVLPVTGIQTQSIESYWAKCKLTFKFMKGVYS